MKNKVLAAAKHLYAIAYPPEKRRIKRTLIEGPVDPLVEQILQNCELAGIEVFLGGSPIPHKRRISFLIADAPKALGIIEELCSSNQDLIVFDGADRIIECANIESRFRGGRNVLHLGKILTRTGMVDFAGSSIENIFVAYIEVGFWRTEKHFNENEVAPTYPHSAIGRIDRDAIPRELSPSGNWDSMDFFSEPRFPIDAIYTWVDSEDPKWKLERSKYDTTGLTSHATGDNRFRNLEELKYSLRSLEMYAPFIRKVFLVTAGHAPTWLNDASDRIEVVSHDKIFLNKDNLPTFNSNAIETALHRVPGLAEHYLYLNDDFFFARPASAAHYFAANGIAFSHPSKQKVNPQFASKSLPEWLRADLNASEAFQSKFGFTPLSVMKHIPYCGVVSIMNELEREFPDLYANCERNRFRSPEDIRPYAFLFPHFASYRGRAVRGKVTNQYLTLTAPDLAETLASAGDTREFDTIVLNDEGNHPTLDREQVAKIVKTFLETYFPIKSSFEK